MFPFSCTALTRMTLVVSVICAAVGFWPSAADAQGRNRSSRSDDAALSDRQAREILRNQADNEATIEDLRTDLQVTQAKVDELLLEMRRLLARIEALEQDDSDGDIWSPTTRRAPAVEPDQDRAAAVEPTEPALPQSARAANTPRSTQRYESRPSSSGTLVISPVEPRSEPETTRAVPPARPEPPAVPARTPPPVEEPEDPFALYEEALNHYHAQSFDQAREVFGSFLQLYPSSRYANNAQFYIGQSFYAQQRYPEAIAAYEAVLRDYPNATKVPSALLKMGYANMVLGNGELARQQLQQVIDTYPYSSEAQLARDRMSSL